MLVLHKGNALVTVNDALAMKRSATHRAQQGARPWCLWITALATIGCCMPVAWANQAERQAAEFESSASSSPTIAGPRQLLGMLGLEDDFWSQWRDDTPISPAESDSLLQILFLLNRFHPADWELWQRRATFADTVERIGEMRGQIVGWTGHVVSYKKIRISDEQRERFELKEAYAVRVAVGESGEASVELVVPRVPRAWSAASAKGQTVFAQGLCLKRLGASTLLLVGPRVHWRPSRASSKLRVTPDQVALVRHGFDLELLDDARDTNGRELGHVDRECFLKMLSAVDRLAKSSRPSTPAVDDIIRLLDRPERWIGRGVRVQGRTRRIAKIMILDERDRRRLGFDSYFQIDLFVDLKGSEIIIQPPPQASAGEKTEPIVLRGVYPVTLCTVELPPALREKLGNQPSGNIRLPCQVDGYLLKLWSYHSPIVARFGEESRQQVPLIIASRFELFAAPKQETPAIWFAAVFLGGLALIAAWVWRTNRADAEARRRWRRMKNEK